MSPIASNVSVKKCFMGDRGQKKFELFRHDLALLRGKSGQKPVSLGAGRFRQIEKSSGVTSLI